MLPVGPNVLQVDYVFWQDRAWLSPVWLQSPDGAMRPIRLIAPRFAPGIVPPPGADVLTFFQKIPLTQPTLEQGFIPEGMANVLHIVENPNVFVRSGVA